jgi:hypothetical protein
MRAVTGITESHYDSAPGNTLFRNNDPPNKSQRIVPVLWAVPAHSMTVRKLS